MCGRIIPTALLLIGPLILFSDVRSTLAHGEPEKVVEGKHVVSLVLVPLGREMRLRFFFRDFKTGHRLLAPISFQIKIRDAQSDKFVFESPNTRANNGLGELAYPFSRDGFYEVFLEFEKADEPGKIYRPDDWYLWIPAGQADQSHEYYGIIAIAGLLAAVSGMACWSQRKENFKNRIHGASTSKERSCDESRL